MQNQSQPALRTSRRVSLDAFVNKIINDQPHLARVKDISETGLYLYRLIEPEMGDDREFGLEIQLPNDDEVIWAVGRRVRSCARHRTNGFGVRFVRISAGDQERIRLFIESRYAEQPMRHSRAA